jgi:hypothetical protein
MTPAPRRRTVVLALIAAALCAVVVAQLVRPARALRRLVRRQYRPRLDPAAPTGALTDDEVRALVAFGESVVEGRALSAEGREVLRAHLVARAAGAPGYLPWYRAGARHLDGLGGAPFATLPPEVRAGLIAARLPMAPRAHVATWRLLLRNDAVALARIVAPDLIAAYYASAPGWRVVGYASTPGQCGELERYTAPEPARS